MGGTCDRSTGQCVCGDAYFGAACDLMMCGGGTTNACNGHGKCMSMYELALNAEDNGDATDYTYGTDPNNAETWDYNKIWGCHCDEGYTGYDRVDLIAILSWSHVQCSCLSLICASQIPKQFESTISLHSSSFTVKSTY